MVFENTLLVNKKVFPRRPGATFPERLFQGVAGGATTEKAPLCAAVGPIQIGHAAETELSNIALSNTKFI